MNIEMQMDNRGDMEKRNTFYAGKKVSEQLHSKMKYDNLKKVIIISILNYNFINLPEYITKTIRVADKHRDYEINNNVEYYYIELPKFRNENPNMKVPINQWLAFIDMERGDLLEMAEKENEIIKEASDDYYVLSGDAELKRLEEYRLFALLEEQCALHRAKNEGKIEGKKEKQLEIAKELLKLGISIEDIQKATKLSIEEINKLK